MVVSIGFYGVGLFSYIYERGKPFCYFWYGSVDGKSIILSCTDYSVSSNFLTILNDLQGVMTSKFRNAGQTCIATNRVYVHESIADTFAAVLTDAVQKQLVRSFYGVFQRFSSQFLRVIITQVMHWTLVYGFTWLILYNSKVKD